MDYKDKTIFITGGTGSLAQGLIKYFLKLPIKKIKIFSRDENKQAKMKEIYNDDRLRYYVGDVRDYERLYRAIENVDILIHTAAMKRIETCEFDPFEAIKTNINGSINVVNASLERKIEKVLNISTDKAVNPSSLYGTTKLAAEKIFIDGNIYSYRNPIFLNVRFGNISNSNGSLFPKIKEYLLKGMKVPITNKYMTRYSLTIDRACELCGIALNQGIGGEIFLSESKSYKIADVVNVIGEENTIEISMRPYEKLHEQMANIEDTLYKMNNYYVILPKFNWYNLENYNKEKQVFLNLNSYNNVFMTPGEIKEEIGR